MRYLAISLAVAVGGLALIAGANRRYAPEMYEPGYMGTVAEAFVAGENYAVFDLNINIRKLRDEHLKRMPERPSLIVLGASQWQEASASLIHHRGYYNAHVHRDYYEDMLGMVELLVRHDKLPRDLVITVRDRLFTPVAERSDYLWLPGIPYFQAMAKRLSLREHSLVETVPLQRPRELLSLAMLFGNVTRWHNASDWPYPTAADQHARLDLLKPDGSIRWSDEHQALFTPARAQKLALAHAEANRSKPPAIDPRGVEALDTLLSYLTLRGVKVHLAHPPFNPIYFEAIKGSAYVEGLKRVEAVTRELAAKHKATLVGSFDPADLGCTADMFIDAEHSQAPCLSNLLAEIANTIDLPAAEPLPRTVSDAKRRAIRSHLIATASGWMPRESTPSGHGAAAAREPLSPLPEPVAVAPPAVAAKPLRPMVAALPAVSSRVTEADRLPPATPGQNADTPATAQAIGEAAEEPAVTLTRPATTLPPAPLAEIEPAPRRVPPRKLAKTAHPRAQAAVRRTAKAPPKRDRPLRIATGSPKLVWPGDRPR
ncbi:MAG: hypothetical protein SFW09_08985 [Hyphomicrobiaceae bacterium]|nr:hypothetical protein [Hyphomicrobiaceae bacterium]